MAKKKTDEVNAVPPEIPASRFRHLATERDPDGGYSILSAWDIPHSGCVVRTRHVTEDGGFVGITDVFVPNVSVRDGKIVRSLV